jgi:adenylosuccinate lyase
MPTTPTADAPISPSGSSPHDTYTSPLASRNASPEMLKLWSPRHKFNTWRRIWLAVAEAQHEVTKDWGSERAGRASDGSKGAKGVGAERAGSASDGSKGQKDGGSFAGASGSSGLPGSGSHASGPLVTAEQVEALRAVVERGITDAELARAIEIERDLRHDVMAHVHCLGESCPEAKAIIHLGCTSQDVVCNADICIFHENIDIIIKKLTSTISAIAGFGDEWKSLPTLGFTHYQPAQPTTVGRRAMTWAHDLSLMMPGYTGEFHEAVRFRGMRGATGTQASFMQLFEGDTELVDEFESRVIGDLWPEFQGEHGEDRFLLSGQTYPRAVDGQLLGWLASIAAVLHKIATDIRLLSNRKEIDEPFGQKQIGSSAMPYKRNPMRCERICGLTRFVMNLVGNAYDTAATQWLERTLDDSSNRRLSLPEAFLALDGALDLMHNVASGLIVHEKMVEKNLMLELPFLATENILMEAVKAGGDRQDLHERIRVHAQEAGHRVKHLGLDNNLIDLLKADPAFASVHDRLTGDDLLDPMKYVGRSVEQTERFVAEVVGPLRERYKDELEGAGDTEPRV